MYVYRPWIPAHSDVTCDMLPLYGHIEYSLNEVYLVKYLSDPSGHVWVDLRLL